MTSMAKLFFKYASDHQKSVYLIGAEQQNIEVASKILSEQYPTLKIAGYRNGFFADEEERKSAVQKIVELQPDYVIVGMGAVVQDLFLIDLKRAGFEGVGFSCGGFFHQIAKNRNLSFYPAWVNKLSLRFAYRMWCEPHTRKRYLKTALLFPFLFVKDQIKK